LAKVQWTFAIGECPIGESLIGEIPISPRVNIELRGNNVEVTSEKVSNDLAELGTRSLDSNTVGGSQTSGQGFFGGIGGFFWRK
jgi:hypothetical protein